MDSTIVKLRAPNKADLNFILNSWLKSYRNSGFAAPMINPVYYKNHEPLLKDLLSSNLITVACNPLDEGQIYGYVVFNYLPGDILVLHYIYTKHSFRRFGIAKQIMASIRKSDDAILYTHHTKYAELLKNKLPIIFDPYKL